MPIHVETPPARRRRHAIEGLAVLGLLLSLSTLPGCNTESVTTGDGAVVDVDEGMPADLAGVDQANGPDLACTPEVESCTGLCGPVRDNCTGVTFQCGACGAGTVCDLDAHTCIVPKVDCPALMRDCCSTKNSCGQTIQCTPATCTDTAEECDPDTNKCVACKQVTCEDLGYECGLVWLGCGPEANKTDCGTCDTNNNCNDALHVCEPKTGGTCGGKTPQQMCDDAKTAHNVECGIITNGCGGLVDCTTVDATHYKCRPGLTCGGAGVPNRCAPTEPPLECIVAGYTCGKLDSACGGTVSCGSCDAANNEVCNLAAGTMAGTCGPICNMPQKTCAADYAGMCGKQLANNCWPALDCNCASGVCSTSTAGQPGTCGAVMACGAYTTGAANQPCSTQSSSSFPKGDGSNLSCPCANAGNGPGKEVCINIDGTTKAGTCCQRATCTAGDTVISDGCGGTIDCCAAAGKQYNATTMMCCTAGDPCSTTYANKYETGVVDGCGAQVNGNGVCDCSRYGQANPSSGSGNACCDHPTCSNGAGGTFCDGRTVAAACNAADTVTCGLAACGGNGNAVCNGSGNTLCCLRATCEDAAHFGKDWVNAPDGCGGQLNCDCSRYGSNRNVNPSSGSGNACCATPTCGGTICAGSVAASCNAAVTVSCMASSCSGGAACCSGGACNTKYSCGSSVYNGKCGTGLTDDCGSTISCACPAGKTCSTSAAGMTGTCQCPSLPTCNAACGCSGGDFCKAGTCCTPQTCPSGLPSGWECGNFTDTCTGNNVPCNPCTGGNKPAATCNTSTHKCECVPKQCCSQTGGQPPSCLGPGPYGPGLSNDDGCGNSGTCSS